MAYFGKPSCSEHMFRPFLVNSTITRLTCFPASRLDSTNALDVFDILSSCIRKGSAGWKSNAPRLIRSVPSTVVTYCKYVTPNRHVIVLSMKKRMMSLLKRSCSSRANGAMIREGER